jgi:hypothetical protein
LAFEKTAKTGRSVCFPPLYPEAGHKVIL